MDVDPPPTPPHPRYPLVLLSPLYNRLSEPPGAMDLELVRHWLSLSARISGAEGRHKALAALRKLFSRQRSAVHVARRVAVEQRSGSQIKAGVYVRRRTEQGEGA